MKTLLICTALVAATLCPVRAEQKPQQQVAGDSRKFEWDVQRIGTQEFLTLAQIAEFYQLPTSYTIIEKRINLDNGVNQLEVTLESREMFVNGVRHWLAAPVMQNGEHILVARIDLAKTIEPAMRPQLVPGYKAFTTVVIDPGHGGQDKGAPSPWGLEKDYALDTGRRLRDLLKAKGYKVVMTRDSDVFIPLEERARIANQYKKSIFVSVHYNSTGTNPDANGVEIFSMTPRGAPSTNDEGMSATAAANPGNISDQTSFPLACAIQHSIIGNTPQFDRGIKRARFAVLRRTTMPSVLVECGFLSNGSEARQVASPAWRGKMASAIAEGVDNYRRLVELKKPYKMLADYRRSSPSNVALRDATVASPGDTKPSTDVKPTSNTETPAEN